VLIQTWFGLQFKFENPWSLEQHRQLALPFGLISFVFSSFNTKYTNFSALRKFLDTNFKLRVLADPSASKTYPNRLTSSTSVGRIFQWSMTDHCFNKCRYFLLFPTNPSPIHYLSVSKLPSHLFPHKEKLSPPNDHEAVSICKLSTRYSPYNGKQRELLEFWFVPREIQ